MKNYEKLIALIAERNKVVSQIESEYSRKFSEFQCEFSKEGIENSGWVEVGFYAAGNEYIYSKNGKKIWVSHNHRYVMVRAITRNHSIHDYEHLEDYAAGLVYSEPQNYTC